jgi:hypothetical protein
MSRREGRALRDKANRGNKVEGGRRRVEGFASQCGGLISVWGSVEREVWCRSSVTHCGPRGVPLHPFVRPFSSRSVAPSWNYSTLSPLYMSNLTPVWGDLSTPLELTVPHSPLMSAHYTNKEIRLTLINWYVPSSFLTLWSPITKLDRPNKKI